MKVSKEFQLKFENIPLMNLRADFAQEKEEIDQLLRDAVGREDELSAHWRDNSCEIEHGLNESMRLTILGIECYLKAAVHDQLHRRQLVTEEIRKKLDNPFSMSRKTPEVYYHCLPSLIHPSLSLKKVSNVLWQKTVALYNEVRNPLFHGYRATNIEPEGVGRFFNHLSDMYDWIDTWGVFYYQQHESIGPDGPPDIPLPLPVKSPPM